MIFAIIFARPDLDMLPSAVSASLRLWLKDESLEDTWINRYNHQRPHQALKYRTPSQYHQDQCKQAA